MRHVRLGSGISGFSCFSLSGGIKGEYSELSLVFSNDVLSEFDTELPAQQFIACRRGEQHDLRIQS